MNREEIAAFALAKLSHLEAPRALLRLAAPARGGAFLGPRGDEFTGKTSRAVIARTIIDGSTSDMMESSGVSDGKLARRLTGKATSWACAEPVVLLPHAPAATKRTSPRQRCWTRHFVKTSTKSRPAYDEKLVWDWCNTTARATTAAGGVRVEYKKSP